MTMDRRSLLLGASTLATFGASGVTESEPQANPGLPEERVQGIGGLFFRSRDPKASAEWYQRHLGIDPTPTDYDQPVWLQAAGPTVFASRSGSFGPVVASGTCPYGRVTRAEPNP